MGSCFSSSSTDSACPPAAIVISLDGSLKDYCSPVLVSSVIGPDSHSCFICDSDSLYFDAYISALDSNSVLQLGHIYFVLPVAKLDYPLSGSDMAALARKASSAMASGSEKRKGRRKFRIMPVDEMSENGDGVKSSINEFSIAKDGKRRKPGGLVVSRPRINRRERLSTINEGDE